MRRLGERSGRRQRGVVLLAVLWVVVILMILASAISAQYRTEQRITRNVMGAAQARAAAEGGVYYALAHLDSRQGPALAGDADWQRQLSLGESSVTVTVRDERGKVDLNLAKGELIRGVFMSAGLPFDQADRLADAILDWRDEDAFRRLHGAEAPEYRQRGYDYGPANADFQTVDELKRVLGITPGIYESVRDGFTVYSGAPDINPLAASSLVLGALPGMQPGMLRSYLDGRRQNRQAGLPPPPFPLGGSPYVSSQVGPAYRIEAIARVGQGMKAKVEAIAIREQTTGGERMRVAAWDGRGN